MDLFDITKRLTFMLKREKLLSFKLKISHMVALESSEFQYLNLISNMLKVYMLGHVTCVHNILRSILPMPEASKD